MSAVSPCVPCCTTPQSVAVPGPQGPTGPKGDGTVTEVTGVDPISVATGTTTPVVSLTGIVPIANGGTGANVATSAFANLIAGSQVAIANGGTGAASAAAALTNLGAQPLVVTPLSSTDASGATLTTGTTPGARLGTVQITLSKAGIWLLLLEGEINGTNVNVATGVTWGVGIYRSTGAPTGIQTTQLFYPADTGSLTDATTYAVINRHLIYTAVTAADVLQVYGWQSGAPTSGTVALQHITMSAIWISAS